MTLLLARRTGLRVPVRRARALLLSRAGSSAGQRDGSTPDPRVAPQDRTIEDEYAKIRESYRLPPRASVVPRADRRRLHVLDAEGSCAAETARSERCAAPAAVDSEKMSKSLGK